MKQQNLLEENLLWVILRQIWKIKNKAIYYNEILTFSHRVRTKNKVNIQQKKDTIESINAIKKEGNEVFNYFKSRIFLIEIINKGDKIKILSSKQLF